MPFDITFGGFINFFLGMFTGMVVLLGTITFLSFRGKHVNLDDIQMPEANMSPEELKQLITTRQEKLKRSLKVKGASTARVTLDIAYELLEEISRYFYPNSKYPMFELSVQELIELNHYISTRVDELLEVPILKNAKKTRIISIINMYEKKKAVQQSRFVKAAKKARLGKVLKYGSMAINAVNPVYWFRKLVLSTSIDAMTRKLCIVIIGVVGEETAKVYSKKLFDKDIDLGLVDENMDDLLKLEEGEDTDPTEDA